MTEVGRGTDAPDRFAEFERWAREHRADEMENLQPDGRIVPDLERAQRWRKLLNEWRAATGLHAVE